MKQIIVGFFIMAVLGSCQKGKTPVNVVAEKTNILTAGTWRFTNYNYNNGITQVTFSGLPACRQDDLRIFRNDGTFDKNEGASRCNVVDAQSVLGQWRFLNDHATRIELDGVEYVVDRLDNTQFEIHSYDPDPFAPDKSYTYNK